MQLEHTLNFSVEIRVNRSIYAEVISHLEQTYWTVYCSELTLKLSVGKVYGHYTFCIL